MAIKSPKHGLTRDAKGWVKYINGKTRRIAGQVDAAEADRAYEARMTELWADAPPKRAGGGGAGAGRFQDDAPIGRLFDEYIHIRRTGGGIKPSTIRTYEDCLQSFLSALPADVRFSEVKDDPYAFTQIHAKWKAKHSVAQLFKRITVVRMAFRWLRENNFISELPKWGDFKQPKAKELKKAANLWHQASGGASFDAAEVKRLLAGADTQMRAMILLAINGGYGNSDCSELPVALVDFQGGWIDYARGKTGNNRRLPLWPETIAALRDAIKISTRDGYAFGTLANPRNGRPGGLPLVRDGDDRISVNFAKLCAACGCHRDGISFYGLRRTFATFASMYGPTLFVKRITGHCSDDEDRIIDNHYIRGDVDKMLIQIVQGVRRELISGTCVELKGAELPAAAAMAAKARAGKRRPISTLRSRSEDTSPSARSGAPAAPPTREAFAA